MIICWLGLWTYLRGNFVIIRLNDGQVNKQLAQHKNGIQDNQAHNNNLINTREKYYTSTTCIYTKAYM